MDRKAIEARLYGHRLLTETIVDQIPERFFKSPTTTFADLAMGGGQYLSEVLRRCEKYHLREQILPRLFGWETNRVYFNRAIATLKGARLSRGTPLEIDMKFDVIIGNPPYNNKGKQSGSSQTSGTSLWLEFLKLIPKLMNEGGWCSLLVPSAVGNTNSIGWKALKSVRVKEITTGVSEKWFKVGTGISQITFEKAPPQNKHLVNGIEVDRSRLPILPANCCDTSLSIFKKITSFEPMTQWKRHNWPEFERLASGKTVVGMSFLDRSKEYKLQSFDELEARPLKKVNICWMETDSPESVKRFMSGRLMSFYAAQTMFSGNLQIGMVKALTVPRGWESLRDDEEIFAAYGLTPAEVEFVIEASHSK